LPELDALSSEKNRHTLNIIDNHTFSNGLHAWSAISKDKWANLEGTFVLPDKPDRIMLYIEGPAPGVNILIESVCVLRSKSEPCCYDGNIIVNPGFEDGVNNWTGKGCKIAVHDSMGDGRILPKSGKFFASTAERTESLNGIQQDITGKVQRKLAYEITAYVRIFGPPPGTDILLDGLVVQHAEKIPPSLQPVIEVF
nr:glycosyl hydrolase family 10 protein / carbohydrate-binding domain-containing protein [Tanacetum cinerariifolium]